MPQLRPFDGGSAHLELRVVRVCTERDDAKFAIIRGIVRMNNASDQNRQQGEGKQQHS